MASFGTSKYLGLEGDNARATAEFHSFAPAPCSCCSCLCPDHVRGRTFLKVYDNHFVSNMPVAPFLCCTTDEKCVVDVTRHIFYDKQPTRVGMCCFVVPMTCCGPPVIFTQKPYCCCCIEMTAYFGETIKAAPSSFCDLKTYLCCGGPCYNKCAFPLYSGVKDGETFLQSWDQVLTEYSKKTGIDRGEFAKFSVVKDSELDHQGAKAVKAPAQANMGGRE